MPDPDDFQLRKHISENRNMQGDAGKIAFSERYDFAIKRLGRNDTWAAKAAGVPRSAVSRYRNGESYPDALAVFALADALGVNPRWLITGEGPQQPIKEVGGGFDGEGELISFFRSLDAAAQSHVLETARILWRSRVSDRMNEVAARNKLHDKGADFSTFEGED